MPEIVNTSSPMCKRVVTADMARGCEAERTQWSDGRNLVKKMKIYSDNLIVTMFWKSVNNIMQ